MHFLPLASNKKPVKLKSLLFALAFLACLSATSQAPLSKHWDRTFGGNDDETFTRIVQTSDSGFLLCGYTRSSASGDVSQNSQGGTDFWIVKTDSLGLKLWDKRFGGSFQERIAGVAVNPGGGYTLAGFTTSDQSGDVSQVTHGSMDFWLVEIDAAGNKLWDKRYGGNSYDQLSSLWKTTDGGYIMGGWTFSDSTGDVTHHTKGGEDYWVVRTDSSGNILWDRNYGGSATEELTCLMQTADGGFILGGGTQSDSSGDVSQATHGGSDMWVVRIDALGNKLWDKRFGGSAGEGLGSLLQTNDGGFILCGGTGSNAGGDVTQPTRDTSTTGFNYGDIWIVKIDSLGNKLWDRRFGGNYTDGASGGIRHTSDNGFLICGNSWSSASGDKTEDNFGTKQTWIIKTDSMGNKLWDKTLFTTAPDESGLGMQTSDGCYVFGNNSFAGIGAYKTDSSRGSFDYWIIKFCESEVPQLPVADFTVSNDSICEGGCLSFNNLSLNASSFRWFFPGGNPDSSHVPLPTNICYSNSGLYDVTLIASSGSLADTVTLSGIVNILVPPAPTITQVADTLFAPPGYNSYQWYFNNLPLPNDTNLYHVITQDGDYILLVINASGCPGLDTAYSITNFITKHGLPGREISVYPNPFGNELRIETPTGYNNWQITIRNILGSEVFKEIINARKQVIHTSGLPSGLYLIEVSDGNNSFVSKLIKL